MSRDNEDGRNRIEWLKCRESLGYFTDRYVHLFNAQERDWVRFRLWPEQVQVAETIANEKHVIILKARQLGMTWLMLALALWLMVFYPASTVLLFSRRDDESVDLLDFRLKGMYRRIPGWMQARAIETDNDHEFRLSNGSVAMAFPTTGGDSYTANLVIVDEADLISDLRRLMASVKPTIDAGGRMVLLSRSEKKKPGSIFKRMYAAAKAGRSGWRAIFLAWWSRPERDQAWYEAQKRDILESDGSLDRLHEQYPETDAEALAPNTLDKRFPPLWLKKCDATLGPDSAGEPGGPSTKPGLPGLTVYLEPEPGKLYAIGADPAEGNPQSDESAACVVEVETGEQVAVLAGRFEPVAFGRYVDELAEWYGADILVERNNHGHAVLGWLRENGRATALFGPDGKVGYLSNAKGKAEMYANAVEVVRDKAPAVRDTETYVQLASVEGGTLRAPEGMHDDRADAWALAQWGRLLAVGGSVSEMIEPEDVLEDLPAY